MARYGEAFRNSGGAVVAAGERQFWRGGKRDRRVGRPWKDGVSKRGPGPVEGVLGLRVGDSKR